jgi:hypothetical protein
VSLTYIDRMRVNPHTYIDRMQVTLRTRAGRDTQQNQSVHFLHFNSHSETKNKSALL